MPSGQVTPPVFPPPCHIVGESASRPMAATGEAVGEGRPHGKQVTSGEQKIYTVFLMIKLQPYKEVPCILASMWIHAS